MTEVLKGLGGVTPVVIIGVAIILIGAIKAANKIMFTVIGLPLILIVSLITYSIKTPDEPIKISDQIYSVSQVDDNGNETIIYRNGATAGKNGKFIGKLYLFENLRGHKSPFGTSRVVPEDTVFKVVQYDGSVVKVRWLTDITEGLGKYWDADLSYFKTHKGLEITRPDGTVEEYYATYEDPMEIFGIDVGFIHFP